MQILPPVRPPKIMAADVNAAFAELKRLQSLYVDGGELIDGPNGRIIKIPTPPRRIRARVAATQAAGASGNGSGSSGGHSGTSSGGSGSLDADDLWGGTGSQPYDWFEQRCLPGGQFEDDPNGRSGSYSTHSAAYESNGHPTPDGSVVWLDEGAVYIQSPASGSGSGASGGGSGSSAVAAPELVEEWTFDYGGGSGPSEYCATCNADGSVTITAGPCPHGSGSGSGGRSGA